MNALNNIHFIYPVTDKTRPWSMVNDLAVKTAFDKNEESTICIWTNEIHQVPYNNFGHGRIQVCETELPTQIGGVKIVWPQYVSDVMRLDILYQYGGVYMDTDIISMMDLSSQIKAATDHNKLIMSWEDPSMTSVCNALMISPPENLFIKTWLDKMPEALQSHTWAQGGVVLPAELAKNPFLVDHRAILHHSFACPLDLSRQWLFDPALKQEAKERIGVATAVHVFETYWRDIIKDITPDWIEKNDCLFSELYVNAR
jgi:hypothetical protein